MANEFDVRASARFVPISPQKVGLVVDMIREMPVNQAMQQLEFVPNAAAGPIGKLLKSAVANAEENFGLNRDDLFVYQAYADKGPIRRWRRFGARGRFKPLRRRYSHITIVLREQEEATG
jgi:large subunit ribosomal protein L22